MTDDGRDSKSTGHVFTQPGRLVCPSEAFSYFRQVQPHSPVQREQLAAHEVSGLHCHHQRTIAQQVQHPFEVVGEHMQAHFRAHPAGRRQDALRLAR